MRDISNLAGKRVLNTLLAVKPNSLVEEKQRFAVRINGVIRFGTVTKYNESTQSWTMQDDPGSVYQLNERQLVKALKLYQTKKHEDTRQFAIVNESRVFTFGTVSNDYQKLNRSENNTYQPDNGTGSYIVYNFNEEFDAFISSNYKPFQLGELGFTSITTFWSGYPYEQFNGSDIKRVFYHSLQSIWANIDDDTKRPLKEESIPLIKAHIWNCIITRSYTKLPHIMKAFENSKDSLRYIFVGAHEEANAATATEEAMADYLKKMLENYHYRDEAISIIESDTISTGVCRQILISILNGSGFVKQAKDTADFPDEELKRRVLHLLYYDGSANPVSIQVAKALVDRLDEEIKNHNKQDDCRNTHLSKDINLKATQEGSGNKHFSICFEDTLSYDTTMIYRIDIDQPVQEIFQLYAQRHYIPIPVKKLQFMYLSKRLTCDTLLTLRSLRVTKDMEKISVFRMFDRISDNPNQLQFIKSPEYTYYVEEGASESAATINFIDTVTYKKVRFDVRDAQIKMNKILKAFAKHVGIPVRDLSFSFDNKVIFMSSFGKLTLEEFLQDETYKFAPNIITVTPKIVHRQEKQQRVPLANRSNIGTKDTKKKHKKSKKKRPIQIAPPEDEEEKAKKQWMFSLYRVFTEAEPTFKEIRQRLNAMNLERTKPKQRTSQSKATDHVKVVDNPLGDGQIGGKAGKTQFIIQVGEVSNLYKTTKHSSAGRGSRRQDDIMIDLHGLSAEEAVYRLDKSLPDWIETAMKGTYPFVIPVKIVCGGGSQILAEVVDNWIKQNDHVANAPKNMYS